MTSTSLTKKYACTYARSTYLYARNNCLAVHKTIASSEYASKSTPVIRMHSPSTI